MSNYLYENENTKKIFEYIMPELEKGIESLLDSKVNFIWIDVGNTSYDIHIEFKPENYGSFDWYFKNINNDLEDVYFSKGFKLSQILKLETVNVLIEKIKEFGKFKHNEELKEKRNIAEVLNNELNCYDKDISIAVDEDDLLYEVYDCNDGKCIKRGTKNMIIEYVQSFNREEFEREQQENIKAYAEMLTSK